MAPARKASAILSVADKTGLAVIAGVLRDRGVRLYATEGTASVLRDAGVDVADIADLTGHPPLLRGRVKALHPAIFAGLMAREDEAEEIARLGYATIDFLIAGITPLSPSATDLAGLDIGGPAMIRAAAKTHGRVVVASHPEDYADIVAALEAGGAVDVALRRELAARAMQRLLAHDAAVLRQLRAQHDEPHALPRIERRVPLRYGENPHQSATLHLTGASAGAAAADQLQGKMPSYTNVLDADAAWSLARRFDRPAAVIVKHAGPCGVAIGATATEAYLRALAADPLSAFGGTVGINCQVDAAAMMEIVDRFTEAVIAPDFSKEALAIAARRPAMRVLRAADAVDAPDAVDVRSVGGGLLVQTRDDVRLTAADLTCVTERHPSAAELEDLLFALEVCRFVKSNAAVTVQAQATIGIGGGQSSRVGAVDLAVRGCLEPSATGSVVLASDAYFPFADSVEVAARAGIAAIVQQGGARRDAEVIASADRLGIAMLVSGIRLFRH